MVSDKNKRITVEKVEPRTFNICFGYDLIGNRLSHDYHDIRFLSPKVNGFRYLDEAIILTVLKALKTIKPNK